MKESDNQMPYAYFDNAATTFPKPEPVYQAMDSFYRTCGVNVGRGQYSLASKAAKLQSETRRLLANLFHAPTATVVFQSSATESMNCVLRGIDWAADMCVYISPFEHNAVLRTLHYLEKLHHFQILELSVDKDSLTYNIPKIQEQFATTPPSVVVVSHASNVCGVVAPLSEIFPSAKKYAAITIADMAQTAGLIDINLQESCADFIIFAGHKTLYGPLGIAGFITNTPSMINPFLYGGTGVDSANLDMPSSAPERFEAGSPNIMAIAGLHASLVWINEIGISAIAEQEERNKRMLLQILKQHPSFKPILSQGYQTGVISCCFDNYSPDNIGNVLSTHDIAVRTGLHCAPRAHQFLGTSPAGTIRFSISYFTNESDFATLSKTLDYIEENA
ncbi:aminotransferase class V-fold PLP-dependent enzyme [Bengtsoniella intestinalis]|uniref:aminotransferase class V-fold PLP-dependent enzyme n=1 Tax=Bengtsoniella intestinalis TaxID=3073143 RepID=UPI00391FC9C3